MNRLLFASILLPLAAWSANAQPLKQYLHTRRSYGIVESVGVAALETLVGTRVFEVQGVVKGTIRTGNKMSVLLERTDGQTILINASQVPDWAIGVAAPARLIVRATRTEDSDDIQATLIDIARDEDIGPIDAAAAAKAAKAAEARRQRMETLSRHESSSRVAAPSRAWVVPSDAVTPYYTAFVKKHNPKLSYSEAQRIAEGIVGFSRQYGVDAQLIVAMVICESDFNPNELSNKGAMGLGQLMPETVHDYGISNPYDSVENLYGTVREIRSHIDKYRGETGDEYRALELGLAAYNAGEGAVRRHGGIPPYRETQAYVKKVVKLYYQLAGYR